MDSAINGGADRITGGASLIGSHVTGQPFLAGHPKVTPIRGWTPKVSVKEGIRRSIDWRKSLPAGS